MAKQNRTTGQEGQAATGKPEEDAATPPSAGGNDAGEKMDGAGHEEAGHENAGHEDTGHEEAAPDMSANAAGAETGQQAVDTGTGTATGTGTGTGTGAGRPIAAASMIGAADSEAINSNLRGLAAGSMRLIS